MGRYDPNTGPRDATWGERHFHVADPDGHELSFARGIVCIRYDLLMARVPMNRLGVRGDRRGHRLDVLGQGVVHERRLAYDRRRFYAA
jgi:hypothetical protein